MAKFITMNKLNFGSKQINLNSFSWQFVANGYPVLVSQLNCFPIPNMSNWNPLIAWGVS